MDMLMGHEIAAANLTDWRKLAQGLHARYVVDGFDTGVRFVAAVSEAGDALGHHPTVSIGNGYVELKLVADDAIYRDAEPVVPERRRARHPTSEVPRGGLCGPRGGRAADRRTRRGRDCPRRQRYPALTVIADQDGNTGILCVDTSAATKS